MDTLKNLTLMQWIGVAIGLNSLFMGATPQLTVLFGSNAVPYIVALATLGNGALGVFVTVIGGQGSQIRNVLAMPGVEKISVNGQAGTTLAAMAVDPGVNKIAPTAAALDAVTATAKAASILLAVVVAGLLAFGGDARAQTPLPKLKPLTGNLGNDLGITNAPGKAVVPNIFTSSDPLEAIADALNAKLLPDLTYALKLANATGSKVTAPCYSAWIDIINTQQKAVMDDGTPPQALPVPDPGIVTKFEKLVELRNALQPDSDFMIKCSPVASMVKKDIVGFIGIVISGGAGLATLVPGL